MIFEMQLELIMEFSVRVFGLLFSRKMDLRIGATMTVMRFSFAALMDYLVVWLTLPTQGGCLLRIETA